MARAGEHGVFGLGETRFGEEVGLAPDIGNAFSPADALGGEMEGRGAEVGTLDDADGGMGVVCFKSGRKDFDELGERGW